MKFLSLLIFIPFLFVQQTKATHILGGEVTYKYISGLKFEVSFKFYRDCRGVSIDTIHAEMKSGSTVKTLSLTKVSIKDVSVYCKKSANPCSTPNTYGAGLGIEEHLYKDTVDFNTTDSVFKKLCKVQFGFGQCCRNTGLVYGSGANFWVWSNLDFCTAPSNSSPIITSIPNNIICCNQSYYYCIGASDTLDGDSLSYSILEPMENWTKKIPFPTPPREWITTYKPPGYKGGTNPSASPPIGTYFDPETGDLIFTPVDCSEQSFVAFRIAEWRKDTSGKYVLIGEVRRDIQYIVQTCPTNNVPLLYGNYRYQICAGNKLCFTVTSDDKVFIPPPPGKAGPADTVVLKWNKGIAKGASFKIIDTTARLPRGQFCWTPKESDARDLPYYFTVMAKDNNCTNTAVTIKSYSVWVKKTAKSTYSKKYIKNGLFELKAILEKDFKGTPQYFWEFLDSAFKPIDTSYYFHSNSSYKSIKNLDSVQFYKGGKYILHYRINNSPLNCPTDYFDTFKVAPVIPILRISPIRLEEKWACRNSVDTLFPILRNAKNPVKFKWSSSATDTLPYLIIKNKKDSSYRVDVHDAAGYHRFAEWKISIYEEPKLIEKKDLFICTLDTVMISGMPSYFADTVYWHWELNGKFFSKNKTITIFKTGIYTLQISDTTNCLSKIDTLQVSQMVIKEVKGLEAMTCVGDTASLSDTATNLSGKKYWNWFFEGKQISTDSTLRAIKTGKYTLEISDSNKCLTIRDTIKFSHMKVIADAGMVKKVCMGDTMKLFAINADTSGGQKSKYFWYLNTSASNPIDSGALVVYRYKTDETLIAKLVQSIGKLKCYEVDTVNVSFRALPLIKLASGSICQNELEFDLHTLILQPSPSTQGIIAWQLSRTLKKPNGQDNTLTDLVFDKDSSNTDKYYIKVDESLIDLKGKFRDSLKLGLIYKDEYGCRNNSSSDATLTIRSNVEVKFVNNELKRCHGDSVIYCSNDFGVNYYGGKWYTANDSAAYLQWAQGNNIQLSENIGTKSLDVKGGQYRLKYVLENNMCFSYKHSILNIIAFPNIKWSQRNIGDSLILYDNTPNADRREWYVNFKKQSVIDTFIISKNDAKGKTIVIKVFKGVCESDSVLVPNVNGIHIDAGIAEFAIFPNPAKNVLILKCNHSKPFNIKISNALGQVMMEKECIGGVTSVDVKNLPSGIYNLHIGMESKIHRVVFIKE